jgi:hypothetical protein
LQKKTPHRADGEVLFELGSHQGSGRRFLTILASPLGKSRSADLPITLAIIDHRRPVEFEVRPKFIDGMQEPS